MNPKVSVIIPNFNHARFLRQRIITVQNQSYTNIEIIILDDCSSDNSRDIIKEFSAKDNRVKIHFNEKNSGSPFKQWQKGIEMAHGDFIWIAESDDFADEYFLINNMNTFFTHSDVGIVYCQSNFVNNNSVVVGNHLEILKSLYPNLWDKDFCLKGNDVLARYMIIMNIIPNASAVVFKKELTKYVNWKKLSSYTLAGDRYFWVSLLLKTNLCFISKSLNFFRIDGDTVRSRHERSFVYLLEILSIINIITKNINVPFKTRIKAILGWLKKFSTVKRKNPEIIKEINTGSVLNVSGKIFKILLGI